MDNVKAYANYLVDMYAPLSRVHYVVLKTDMNAEQAIAELVAEEGDSEAVIDRWKAIQAKKNSSKVLDNQLAMF